MIKIGSGYLIGNRREVSDLFIYEHSSFKHFLINFLIIFNFNFKFIHFNCGVWRQTIFLIWIILEFLHYVNPF